MTDSDKDSLAAMLGEGYELPGEFVKFFDSYRRKKDILQAGPCSGDLIALVWVLWNEIQDKMPKRPGRKPKGVVLGQEDEEVLNGEPASIE